MARSFTNTTENDVLNWLFGTSGYTPHPSNLVLRLSTTIPADDGTITEPSGGSYAEQAIAFGAASGGVVSNSSQITFPEATGRWGKIVGWAVRDTVASVTLATGYMGSFYDVLWSTEASTDAIQVFTGNAAPAVNEQVFFVATDPDGGGTGASWVEPYAIENPDLDGYWVISSSGDTFTVSRTRGGAAADILFAVGGPKQVWLSKIKTIDTGDQLVIPAGAIQVRLK